MNSENVKWSSDGETFNYDSLEELLDSDDGIEAGRVVYFGTSVELGTDWVSVGDVLEMIGERAYDQGGEWAEDFPDVPKEAERELEAFLTEWQAKHCKPTFWRIAGATEHTVTAAELAEAQA